MIDPALRADHYRSRAEANLTKAETTATAARDIHHGPYRDGMARTAQAYAATAAGWIQLLTLEDKDTP